MPKIQTESRVCLRTANKSHTPLQWAQFVNNSLEQFCNYRVYLFGIKLFAVQRNFFLFHIRTSGRNFLFFVIISWCFNYEEWFIKKNGSLKQLKSLIFYNNRRINPNLILARNRIGQSLFLYVLKKNVYMGDGKFNPKVFVYQPSQCTNTWSARHKFANI